ncbi:MAG: putative metal-binding motif-containing protein, partial [Chitinophagales bacterium]|nr:putative metal-binding motif-containing protein [Chitinophagales bacterium]
MKCEFFILLVFFTLTSFSQAPEIEWQNTIGGISSDELSICQTQDGGYIIGGSSQSGLSGDKTEPGYGAQDYWVLKLDSLGEIQWQKSAGGGSMDNLYDLCQTNDGGYILGGSSLSDISGNKTEATIAGSFDYWIVKLDSLGNILWQNNIGGSGNDQLYSVDATLDGGCILGGYSNSPISGDKTENNILGSDDYWVVKLNSTGDIEWQNVIGGSGQDWLYCIRNTTDNGYIISGRSYSGISGDKTEENIAGSSDFWIIKLDSSGVIQWQNTIGGNLEDWPLAIEQTDDKGFIVGGLSNSNLSGDKTEASLGTYDYWVVKLDSLGNIDWQNTIGGSLTDVCSSLRPTIDDGYIVGGSSYSGISGDKTELNVGFSDYWLIKLDNIGNILWQKTIGGWSDDNLITIQDTQNNGYIVGGWSNSPFSGDKTEDNVGVSDFWIVKLFPDECTPLTFYADMDGDSYGNALDSVSACFAPFGYITDNTDCNDADTTINPGYTEVCNAVDDNCNFLIDEGIPFYIYYLDADLDGYGNIIFSIAICSDFPPTGYVIDNTDCDDSNNLIHESILYYSDTDGDLFGDVLNTDLFCSIIPPTGYVSDSTDCDDLNPSIYTGAEETLNDIDDNCNETIDEGFNIINTVTSTSIQIYPNPNNGVFVITVQNFNSNKLKIEVFN